MLADLTKQVSCTILEVSTNVEPPVQLASGAEDPVEPAGAGAESPGLATEAVGIEDRAEPLGRGPDDGEAGTVLREEERPVVEAVVEEIPASADTADSGLREDTSGDSVIVATGELK